MVCTYHLWAQSVVGSKDAILRALTLLVFHWHSVFAILQQTWTRFRLLTHHASLPAVFLGTAPGPPCLSGAVAIDGTASSDGDICLLEGVDAG